MILAAVVHDYSSEYFMMALSIIVILSYFFNIIAHKTNIPSVILLIALGIFLEMGLKKLGLNFLDNYEFVLLKIIGTVGLIMIVLEAALDLKLESDKKWLLIKSFLVALLVFLISSTGIAFLFKYAYSMDLLTAMIYAIPLSIMSSAIIIPSVNNLMAEKKEFMIYESTFSDIIGIMAFYMLIGGINSKTGGQSNPSIIGELTLSTLLTAVISITFSYLMVILFQNIRGHGKLVLMVCILMLIYATGKVQHLSPLLLILMFGLVLNNKKVFFRGYLKKLIKEDDNLSELLLKEFKVVTIEASFLVRTVFFVLFGMSIALDTLVNPVVLILTGLVLLVLYFVRWINLKLFIKTSIYPELFIAPRGLITILLFYAIPANLRSDEFDTGILLLTIICTSLIMMLALMLSGGKDMIEEVESAIGESETHGNLDIPHVQSISSSETNHE